MDKDNSNLSGLWKKLNQATPTIKKKTMVVVLIVVTVMFAILTDGKMLNPSNVTNLILQNAYVFVLATGMLLCILTGGNIDLSVGSIVCIVGAIGAKLMVNMQVNIYLAILVMIGVGTLIGAWHGFLIAVVRIPPFIATLAGMLIFRGLSNVILEGLTISSLPKSYLNLFNTYVPDIFNGPKDFNITCMVVGVFACMVYVISQIISRNTKLKKGYEVPSLLNMTLKMVFISIVVLSFMFRLAQHNGIPAVLFWIVVIILIYNFITSKTTFGRYFYAVGGNEKASRLSGINTQKVYFTAYLNMGFLSAIAGMITMSRLYSATPTSGNNYELDAIAACFIGGASAYGGIGTVPGVIIGAILMGVINLGMFIMGVDSDRQKIVKGIVLLAAVAFDVVSKKSGKRN